MKKLFFATIATLAMMPAIAQDTYESARLIGGDLNGTARYVGMGGALEALGADISTIGTNPAGVGLFRRSSVNISFGAVSQQGATKFDNLSKTNMSFDQVGFVYSSRMDEDSYINFAFNLHKSRNFDQILSAANRLGGISQNGLTYHKATKGNAHTGGYTLDFNNQDEVIGYENETSDWRAQTYSQSDYLNANMLLLHPDDQNFYWTGADSYGFDRAHRGYIYDYDFNLSGNANNRVYWGLTFGVRDAHYKGYSEYIEGLVDADGHDAGTVVVGDERRIKGYGFNVKAGVIVRPIEESAFRVGLTVATPTWYDLTSENTTEMLNNSHYGSWKEGTTSESYDFKFFTPWQFGVSLGHTIGSMLALGASYEYADYGASKNRIKDGYDYYGDEDSFTDELMKRNAEYSLKGVSTIKLGAELKPVPELAVRLGYNYVTAAYDKNGVRDMMIDSPGVMYASTTDYTNWGDTHRITSGLGFKAGKMNIDLAYQYSMTKGDFHPLQDYQNVGSSYNGVTSVDFKRHQLLLTLGYTF